LRKNGAPILGGTKPESTVSWPRIHANCRSAGFASVARRREKVKKFVAEVLELHVKNGKAEKIS